MFIYGGEWTQGSAVYNLFPPPSGRAVRTSQEFFQRLVGKSSSKRKTVWVARLMKGGPRGSGASGVGNTYFIRTLHEVLYEVLCGKDSAEP